MTIAHYCRACRVSPVKLVGEIEAGIEEEGDGTLFFLPIGGWNTGFTVALYCSPYPGVTGNVRECRAYLIPALVAIVAVL